MPQFRGVKKEGPMDRKNLAEDGVEELGIASVETLGTELPFPEPEGLDIVPHGGITAD